MSSGTNRIAIRTSKNTMAVFVRTHDGKIVVTDHLWAKAGGHGTRPYIYILNVIPNALNKKNFRESSRIYRFHAKESLLEDLHYRFGFEVTDW